MIFHLQEFCFFIEQIIFQINHNIDLLLTTLSDHLFLAGVKVN